MVWESPRNGLGEPRNQPRNGLESQGIKLALDKLKRKLSVKTNRPAQKWSPNRSRAPRNGLGKFQNQPRNGLESQGTKLVLDKLNNSFQSKEVNTFGDPSPIQFL